MMSSTSHILPAVPVLALFCATWAAAQIQPVATDANVAGPGLQGVGGLLTHAVLENGCFSCYSTTPKQPSSGAGTLRIAGQERSSPRGMMEYVELDTLIVVYPHYQRDFTGGRVQVDLSTEDIGVLKAEVAEATSFLWRSSNCKCFVKTDWKIMSRTLTPAQLWDLSGKGGYWLTYWSIGGASVEQDLQAAGVADGQYSVVVVLYAFENSEGATAAIGGGAYGVDIGFLRSTSYLAIPLAWGLDCSGVFIHEYLHALDSIYTASGNPYGNDMGHADHPELFNHPADCGRHFNFLLANVLSPDSWLALDSEWARLATAPDADQDGVPDRGDLPITEESFGSSPTGKDTDGDRLDDLKELTATYYRPSDPQNPDTDADGLPDGADPYPLLVGQDQAAKHVPQIDGAIKAGEYVRVAHLVTTPRYDLEVSAYAAWSDDILYLAADVTDSAVQTPYTDPFWQFNDNFEVNIDGRRDGWLTGDQRNYRFYVVPVGPRSQPYVFGEFGSRASGPMAWSEIDVSAITAKFALRAGGYRIEMAIPAQVMNGTDGRVPDVRPAPNSSVRLTFSVRDLDAYADWPEFNVFTAEDRDTPAFVELHFTP